MDDASISLNTPLLDITRASVVQGQGHGHQARILDDVSLRIEQGQHTAILGRNGSGKSTLVKLITHQLHPLGGAGVRVFGRDRWDVFELRRLLGIVSSTLQAEFADGEAIEVSDAVTSGFFAAHGVWRQHRVTVTMREQAQAALVLMGVEHLVGRQMARLSTGEARRVLIARALVHQPRALLLDEPCAGLDPATRRQFLDSLRTVAARGTTLILVTHHIEEILPEIDRVVMMQEGRIIADGAKADVLTSAGVTDLFGMAATVHGRAGWNSLSFD